jgi:hypothetical protein
MPGEQIRLADLLAALSVATDLGNGQEPEKAIRACLVATELARRTGEPEARVSDVYYTALLRHLGCTATAHEESYVGGDELVSRPSAERADFGNPREVFALVLQTGRGTGLNRPKHLTRALRLGKKGDRAILGAICEVGARLAERLGLGSAVRDALYQVFERWDGKGPHGLIGEAIGLPAQLAEVGHQAVIFDRLGGPDSAVEMIRRRSGGGSIQVLPRPSPDSGPPSWARSKHGTPGRRCSTPSPSRGARSDRRALMGWPGRLPTWST